MKITLKSVRIYGSKSSYGSEPHLMPEHGYIELPKYPAETETSFVVLGKLVEEFFDAEGILTAVAKSMLGRLKGLSLDDGVRECLADQKRTEKCPDYNWYVTLWVERNIEVDSSYLFKSEYLWIDWSKAEKIGQEFSEYTKPFLDILATYSSTIVEPGFFAKVILDRVFFFSSEHPPMGSPEFSLISEGSQQIPLERLDVGILNKLFVELCGMSPADREWILTPIHWYLESLKEKDPWKKFLWSFWALEVLSKKYIDKYHGKFSKASDVPEETQSKLQRVGMDFEALKKEERYLPLSGKFGIMALDLSPDTAEADIKEFIDLNEKRSKLSHGGIKDSSMLPIEPILRYLKKYVSKVIHIQAFKTEK
jgi:hypothetical protein